MRPVLAHTGNQHHRSWSFEDEHDDDDDCGDDDGDDDDDDHHHHHHHYCHWITVSLSINSIMLFFGRTSRIYCKLYCKILQADLWWLRKTHWSEATNVPSAPSVKFWVRVCMLFEDFQSCSLRSTLLKTQTIAKQWPTCDDCDAVRVVKSCQVHSNALWCFSSFYLKVYLAHVGTSWHILAQHFANCGCARQVATSKGARWLNPLIEHASGLCFVRSGRSGEVGDSCPTTKRLNEHEPSN